MERETDYEMCRAAEMQEVLLEYDGDIRYDVIAKAEAICHEETDTKARTASWQQTVKKAVIAGLAHSAGMW